jgi:hypothetical protein
MRQLKENIIGFEVRKCKKLKFVKLGMERQREHACTSTGYGHLTAINIPGAVRLPPSEP